MSGSEPPLTLQILRIVERYSPKGLPVAGVETAKKLVDETLPSNTLMKRWPESTPKDGS